MGSADDERLNVFQEAKEQIRATTGHPDFEIDDDALDGFFEDRYLSSTEVLGSFRRTFFQIIFSRERYFSQDIFRKVHVYLDHFLFRHNRKSFFLPSPNWRSCAPSKTNLFSEAVESRFIRVDVNVSELTGHIVDWGSVVRRQELRVPGISLDLANKLR